MTVEWQNYCICGEPAECGICENRCRRHCMNKANHLNGHMAPIVAAVEPEPEPKQEEEEEVKWWENLDDAKRMEMWQTEVLGGRAHTSTPSPNESESGGTPA